MKQLLLNNWKPKIGSLLVATAIWYLIKSHVERVPAGRNYPQPIPGRSDDQVRGEAPPDIHHHPAEHHA